MVRAPWAKIELEWEWESECERVSEGRKGEARGNSDSEVARIYIFFFYIVCERLFEGVCMVLAIAFLYSVYMDE